MNEWFIRYCSIAAGLYIMSIYMYIYVKNIKMYKKWHAIPSVHINSHVKSRHLHEDIYSVR